MDKSRTAYFDYLKIIATFAVVVIHTVAKKWYSAGVESTEWQILNLYDSLSRWAVPIFVMVSGALFLDEKNRFHINIYLGRAF